MAETEQQDETLSELIVKEAVTKGMQSPMREPILEAVEESEGGRSSGRLPLAGILVGLGASVGFLLGRQSTAVEDTSLADVERPEIIEDRLETDESAVEDEPTEAESASWLSRALLAVGLLAGAAALRRRLAADDDEAWEPIEEFEPATDIGEETDTDDESDLETGEPDEDGEE